MYTISLSIENSYTLLAIDIKVMYTTHDMVTNNYIASYSYTFI